ncbi:MAG: pantetheine-phosphate adenylyltransferase [Clostridia bacterium]|nr:pantetheine-phosphate adenylyltransferase [Clostridia bacterium]
MSDKNTVLIPGSFDPLTMGHYDVVMRARALFGRIYVVGFVNSEKSGFFTPDERLDILRSAFSEFPEIITDVSGCMVSDYAESVGAGFMLKGVRSPGDFEYEFSLAEIERRLCPGLETVMMPSRPEFAHISSTFVRELLKYGKSLEGAVPESALEKISEIMKRKAIKQ